LVWFCTSLLSAPVGHGAGARHESGGDFDMTGRLTIQTLEHSKV